MKKQFVCIICLSFLFFSSVRAQNIPNGGFENWENRVLYSEPVMWNTGNTEAFLSGAITATPTNNSFTGVQALRLETVVTDNDTLFGYAFCNGTVTGGSASDTLHFTGGIPVSAAPDSILGYFKFHIADNDTGIVVVSFKNGGNIISQNIFSITGTQNTYTRIGWEIESMGEVPDTVMVAFACSYPDHPQVGGWMQIDSLWFDGIADEIPNNSFEEWEDASYLEPEHWITANLFSYLFGGDTCATPTSDAHSGTSAIRIESIQVPVPSENGGFNMSIVGFAMPYTGTLTINQSMPTFAVESNPTLLTGYYKFTPVLNDTALVFINLIDDQDNEYPQATILLPANDYTPFELELTYPPEVSIVKASIILSTTIYFMQGDGDSGEIGSVLYVDDMNLFNPCDTFPEYHIANVQQPTCGDHTAIIDAGIGWDEYLWSTDDTTQTITVNLDELQLFSVTVTNSETGCQFTDEVQIGLPVGCDAIQDVAKKVMSVDVFPNPSSGSVNLEFINLVPGEYNAEIISITGKVVMKQVLDVTQAKRKYNLNLSELPEGLYLVKISGNKFTHCERIILN
jgi:hypothetical protein